MDDAMEKSVPAIELDGVSFAYEGGRTVLDGVSAAFCEGRMYAITGPSGSGKSTLLSLLGGLDVPDAGAVRCAGEAVDARSIARHRRHGVSFVFQGYNLVDYLTPAENVALATRLPAEPLLARVGIGEQEARRSVLELSGGQQQRVAIARALGSDARVLLCDEPTGSLDEATAAEVGRLLLGAAHDEGRCVIVVTHSRNLARRADEAFRLRKGRLMRER